MWPLANALKFAPVTTIATALMRLRMLPKRLVAAVIVGGLGLLTTVLAVTGRAPYDDEIANFHVVRGRDVPSIIRLANSVDVHPPGSYVINKLSYDLLGSWEGVKIAGGCINALALALLIWLAYEKLPPRQRAWLTFCLATASTTILWGASVRWYAYFNPVFTATFAILLFSDIPRTARTAVFGVAAVISFYIGYAAVCGVVILAAAHVGRDWPLWTRRDVAILLSTGILAGLACGPQLLVFLQVHSRNQGAQVGGPVLALLQSALTVVLGNAVFPIAVVPIVYGLLIACAVGFWLFTQDKSRLQWVTVGTLALGLTCMAVTGIGIKPRNSAYLLPIAALVICSAIASLPRRSYAAVSVALVAFQSLGVWNVITHDNTIKGSYNTDFQSAMRAIQKWRGSSECRTLVVFNHDPVMSYLLDRAGIAQSSPYEETTHPAVQVSRGECLAIVETYRGVIPSTVIGRMYGTVRLDTDQRLESRDIGYDRSFVIKGRLLHDSLPAVQIRLELWRARRDVSLPDWSTFATAEGAARATNE
jgi:hypothetical protein